MGLLDGKRALIVGVASNRSIAWGIAQAMHREGAELAFTYQNEKLRSRVEKFAADADSEIIVPCDVSSDDEILAVFEHLDDYWDHLDILIHSVAYAPREQLEGEYLESVTREGFLMAHEISSYSFTALADAARRMMQGRKGAMLTLSYIGAVRVMPNYNIMGVAKASLEANMRYMASSLGPEGIRVNAISAGPIRTLAASGIKGLRKFMSHVEEISPLRRNVTIDEVGNAAAFLCSDYASAITGETTYVDCGYNSVGAA
ncbi:MAG: enoyl-ACP reductase [Proteobacteria bacterium]|nr:enoyl-ACP reductase [Pseudomonadota bacterium]